MIIPIHSIKASALKQTPRSLRCLAASLCLLFLLGCTADEADQIELAGETMGTTYSIKLVGWPGNPLILQQSIDQRLEEINDAFSTYRPDSELSLLNRAQYGNDIEASEELISLIKLSQEIHRLTDGAFDVTVGPLVNLWGFGPNGPRDGVPSQGDIDAALLKTGFEKIAVAGSSVNRPDGLYIDLSAIAKGYAVDEVAEVVEASGALQYMIEIGGEVLARGNNRHGQPWIIGVEAPDRTRRVLQRALPLVNTGMATSGDYRNFFEHDGQAYSHTIDPRTGWPVTHNQASVTVLHPSTAMADGLATAFSVLGPEETQMLAEEMNLPVLAIIREKDDYREVQSTAMQRYLTSDK